MLMIKKMKKLVYIRCYDLKSVDIYEFISFRPVLLLQIHSIHSTFIIEQSNDIWNKQLVCLSDIFRYICILGYSNQQGKTSLMILL